MCALPSHGSSGRAFGLPSTMIQKSLSSKKPPRPQNKPTPHKSGWNWTSFKGGDGTSFWTGVNETYTGDSVTAGRAWGPEAFVMAVGCLFLAKLAYERKGQIW